MRLMGLEAICQAPRTSTPHPQRRIYPYLPRNLTVVRPAHVWCAAIPSIPVRRGFLYLIAIMDWATRHVLARRLSNAMDAGFCGEALREAMARYGKPEICNADQGGLPGLDPGITSLAFTGMLKDAVVTISMGGAAAWTTSLSNACGARGNTRPSTARTDRRLRGPARHRRVDRLLQYRAAALCP